MNEVEVQIVQDVTLSPAEVRVMCRKDVMGMRALVDKEDWAQRTCLTNKGRGGRKGRDGC